MKKTIFNLGTVIILILVTVSVSADVQAYADLSVQYVNVYSAAYTPGDLILVTNHIKNVGTTSSNSYTVSFYASTNSFITSADYYLGSVSRSSLAAGATHYYFTVPSLPSTIPLGNYYIGLIVSCSNDFNSSNNTGYDSTPIAVLPYSSGYADISIESVNAANGTYHPGDEIVVGSLLENEGSVQSESFTVDIYASVDRIIAPGDYLLSSMVWSGLSAGESFATDKTVRFPEDIPSGEYYIGMRIYCANDSNTGNNRRYDYQKITVVGGTGPGPEPEPEPDPDTPPPPPPPVNPPDLSVLSVDAANGSYEPGDAISVTTSIKNIGEQTSNSYNIKYYASSNSTITSSDYLLGSSNRSGLAANAQQSFTASKHFPSDIPTSNYYIGVTVTCSNDSNASNNKGYDSVKVRISQPIQSGHIHGRITYTDRNNGTHPVRYALVNITDSASINRTNVQTYTDSNGEYDVSVAHDIRGRSITMKVSTEGVYKAGTTTRDICKVQDAVNKNTYYKTKTSSVSSQNSSIEINLNIPENTSGSNRGAFNVFDSVVEAFLKARTVLEITPNELPVYWPAEKTILHTESLNNVLQEASMNLVQDDRWDRDVIMHEYGHYIHRSYAFAIGSAGTPSSHTWNDNLRYDPISNNLIRSPEQAMNYAFRESWATLFSIATQHGNTGYPYSGDAVYNDTLDTTIRDNLESDTSLHSSPGELYESMNCCTLWDIFDNNNSSADNNDTVSDLSLDRIWMISRYDKPDTIEDFWNSWVQRYSNTSSIRRLFNDHRMTFVP